MQRWLLMTYEELLSLLVEERLRRYEDDRQGWSRTAMARRLGVSSQVFTHWETQRNRAGLEQLADWAAIFGRRLVVSAPPKSVPPLLPELHSAMSGLDRVDQDRVIRYAQLLGQLTGRDYSTLTSIVDAMEKSFSSRSASGRPA